MYDEQRPATLLRPSRAPLFAALAVVGLAALGTGGYFAWKTWLATPPYAALHAPVERTAGAYDNGGAPPASDATSRDALVDAITKLAIAADRDETLGPFLATTRRAAVTYLGEERGGALADLLDEIERLRSEQATAEDRTAFRKGLDAWNRANLAADGDYVLYPELRWKADVGPTTTILTNYRVERIHVFEEGDRVWRVLHAERLDRLNYTPHVLGFVHGDFGEALVLASQVEGWLTRDVLPALAPEGRYALAAETLREDPPVWLAAVERRAAQELVKALSQTVEPERLEELGTAGQRRADVYRRIVAQLAEKKIRARLPGDYELDPDEIEQLKGVTALMLLSELKDVVAELGDADLCEAFVAIRDQLTAGVVQHELQHAVDRTDGLALAGVGTFEPFFSKEDFGTSPQARSALAETSAYLAAVARGGPLALLELAQIVRFIIDREMWGRSESYAALFGLRALAEQLGVEHDPLLVGRTLQPEAAAALYIAICDKGPAEVAQAARAAWESLLQRPFPKLTAKG